MSCHPPLFAAISAVDYAELAVYLLAMVAVGAYFSREQHSTKDFFLANRSMGALPVAVSITATLLSALSYTGIPAESYHVGLMFLLSPLAAWLALPILIRYILPLYRGLKLYTVYEYLELRFDATTRLVSSILFVVWRLLWLGGVLYAPCKALVVAAGLDVDVWVLMVTLGFAGTLYTFLGGMKAVIWTDVIQACVMLGGLVFIVGAVWWNLDGGPARVWEVAESLGRTELMETGFDWSSKWPIWGMLPHLVLAHLSFYVADQVTVQRFLAVKSLQAGRRSLVLNAVGVSIMVPALMYVGMALLSFYHDHPDALRPKWVTEADVGDRVAVDTLVTRSPVPADGRLEMGEVVLNEGANDELMPWFITNYLPVGVAGFILAALLAASMSSLDSGINSVCALFVVDFHRRRGWGKRWLARKLGKSHDELTETDELKLGRRMVLVVGFLATIFSLCVAQIGDIFTIMVAVINTFGGPLTSVFLLGIFTRRCRAAGALAALALGTFFTLWLMVSNGYSQFAWLWPWEQRLGGVWHIIFGMGFTFAVGYVLSFFCGRAKSTEELRGLVVGCGKLGERGAGV